MEALTLSHVRANLTEVMRRVNEDRTPVIMTSQLGKPVVMMALDDFNAMEETAYLLRNPKGAKRLMASVERLRTGKGTVRELIDADQV